MWTRSLQEFSKRNSSRRPDRSFNASPVEKCRDVTASVNDGDNLYRTPVASVDDQVVLNWPEKYGIVSKVFPLMAHAGMPRQGFEGVQQQIGRASCRERV